jgi:hypothetical protein
MSEKEIRKHAIGKSRFEKEYCERSGITIEQYQKVFNMITLKCNCDEEECRGWAAVTNTPLLVKVHKEINGID